MERNTIQNMSGGYYDYGYYKLDQYEGHMKDSDLNEMIRDLKTLLHDLEWCDSGDINEFDYAKTANTFKEKWMPGRDTVLAEVDRRWEISNHYNDVLYKFSHLPRFCVMHYDYNAKKELDTSDLTTYRRALEDFATEKPMGETDRVELWFFPDEEEKQYNDNILLKYKVANKEGMV